MSIKLKYDAIVMPTVSFVAPKFEQIKKLTPLQEYTSDFITVGPNLAGLPHITIPIQKQNDLPFGMMFVSNHFKESNVITLGSAVEELLK